MIGWKSNVFSVVVLAVVLAVVGGLGYVVGRKLERALWVEKERAALVEVDDETRRANALEQLRIIASAQARAEQTQRARQISRAPAPPVVARFSDAERMRLEALRRAWFPAASRPIVVRESLPDAPGDPD